MNFKAIISQFIFFHNELIVVIWNVVLPFTGYGLMLNFHVQNQNKKVFLEDEFLANRTLILPFLGFGQFVFDDKIKILDFGELPNEF
jgi:hypothetical protein